MKHRLFVDTNVLLDFFLEREPFAQQASKLLDAGLQQRCEIFTSAISFCNLAFILRHIEKKRIVEKDLELLLNCLTIAPNNGAQLGKALQFRSKDYEDAIHYTSALETKCTHLVTSNATRFRNARITVLDTQQALGLLELA